MKKSKQQTIEDTFLITEPLAITAVENSQGSEEENSILKLQLTMATNSINHEYARMEFEDTMDKERQEELLEYMASCRRQYFEARESLVTYDSNAVQEFETDLLQQKFRTLNRFNA